MKLIRPFLFALLVIFTSIPAISQSGNLFTAKEGWQATKTDYSEYELIMVMAEGPEDSAAVFDLDAGTSDVWHYLYRNINNSSDVILVYVIKSDDNYFPLLLSEDESAPIEIKKLDDVNWLNSNEFVQRLKNNNEYNQYINSNKINSSFVSLVYSYDSEGGSIPPDFVHHFNWIIFLNNTFTCITDAITGKTQCDKGETTIKDLVLTKNINIFPQPATDKLNILIPGEQRANLIEIYNLYGEKIYERRQTAHINMIQISTSNFSAGTYFVRINTNSGIVTKKITILK